METKIVLAFIEAINCADVDKMYDLMAIDHLFIDSQDHRMAGKDNMRQGWIGYFDLFPDFKIEINEIHAKDSMICMFGYASATYKNLVNEDNSNYWRIPAAWRAIIEDGQIKLWQVYADNIIVMEIVNRNK